MATETVVSTKVLGSSNPIAKKFRAISNSFKGVGCGFIMLVIGLTLIYQSVYGVTEYSKILESLPLESVESMPSSADLVKVKGNPSTDSPVTINYEKCSDTYCYSKESFTTEPAYYITVDKQRFEVVKYVTKETVTKDVGGSEVEETVEKIEYKEEWVSKEKKSLWANILIDSKLKIEGSDKVRILTELSENTINGVYIDNLQPLNNYGQNISSQVGGTRLVYSYIPINESPIDLIVTGRLQNLTIKDGSPFILTTMSDNQLIKMLGDEENMSRTAYLIGSWLLVFLGLSMIIAPIIELVKWIPLFGWAAKTAAGIISFIIATLLVLGGWVILKFWWLIIIVIIVIIAAAIILVNKSKANKAKE